MAERENGQQGAPILLRGARVIDPARAMDGPGAVVIADGRIVACGLASGVGPDALLGPDVTHALARLEAEGRPARVVELPGGWVVAPGFVDLHAHLREPGFEAKETVRTGTHAAARGGFTTICAMPNTNPVIDTRAGVEFVQRAAAEAPARVRVIAAISKGEQGHELSEMGELADAGVVAFSDDGRPVSSGKVMRHALEYAAPLGLPVVEHCQDEELVGDGVMHEGAAATRLGLKGWPAAGEVVMLARDLE